MAKKQENSVPNNFRRFTFDVLFFTYSLAIIVHLTINSIAVLDKEYLIQNMHSASLATLGLLLVAVVLTVILQKAKIVTFGDALFDARGRHLKSFWFSHVTFILLLSLWISLQVTESSFTELLDPDGLGGAMRLWSGLTQPNFALLPKVIVETIETVYIAFLATVLAIPAAFLLAFFAAKNLMRHPVSVGFYTILRLVMNISRSVEPLVWALIFTVWVGVGPFAGMLALMIHSIASLTKYYSEILESVSEGPIDGLTSTGARPIQIIWYAVVPQVILPYIAMTVYRWDTNVRMATVIGLVGGGGIGTLLIQYQGQAMWPEVGCIILVIAIVVWLMDTASAYIREALK